MTKPLAVVIEDDPQLSRIFSASLRDNYTVEAIVDGNKAMAFLEHAKPQLVLLDLHLPGLSGEQILFAIRSDAKQNQPIVILCTADARMAEAVQEQADFVLLKPVSPLQLRQLASRLRYSNTREQSHDSVIEAWARALEQRDKETEGHTRRVTELAIRLARAMNLPEEQIVHLRRGALLHDIGKMAIPDKILLKTGPLSLMDQNVIRQHPSHAYDLLYPIEYLRPALDVPYCHHEKWDGTGYPRGLAGEEIPLLARIFSIVDVWDAITTDRSYRSAWDKDTAIAYIVEQSGRHFDPAVVNEFLKLWGNGNFLDAIRDF